MSKKKDILIEKYEAIQAIGTEASAPWEVHRILGGKRLSIMGDQLCFGDDKDYATLAECRYAIEWYAKQLGGSVKWSKSINTPTNSASDSASTGCPVGKEVW